MNVCDEKRMQPVSASVCIHSIVVPPAPTKTISLPVGSYDGEVPSTGLPPRVTKAIWPVAGFIFAMYDLPPTTLTATTRLVPSGDQEGSRNSNTDCVARAQCLLVPSAFIR